MARYIFITGGVVSSLGKGLMAASLAALLQARGYKVRIRKFDPYLNVDPGTMSPYQHGEVYVTDDGAETDLDLGHYERFTGVSRAAGRQHHLGPRLSRYHRQGTARRLSGRHGAGDPACHRCDQGIRAGRSRTISISSCAKSAAPWAISKACRLSRRSGSCATNWRPNRAASVHVTLVPYISAAGELKTKPTQHSVRELTSLGVQPNVLLCRCEHPLPESERAKIALFCNVRKEAVIPALDATSIYAVPLQYHAEGLDTEVLRISAWRRTPAARPGTSGTILSIAMSNPEGEVTIGVVGKYVGLPDAYKSLNEALVHGGMANRVKVNIRWIDAEVFEQDDDDIAAQLEPLHGILVPGGFGERGSEGKIASVRFARERKVPFFGICLGMQMACVEGARNTAGIASASSTEFGEHR